MKKLSLILASALLLGGISFASPIVKQAAPAKQTTKPAAKPASKPTTKPAAKPAAKPAVKPAAKPKGKPSGKPPVHHKGGPVKKTTK